MQLIGNLFQVITLLFLNSPSTSCIIDMQRRIAVIESNQLYFASIMPQPLQNDITPTPTITSTLTPTITLTTTPTITPTTTPTMTITQTASATTPSILETLPAGTATSKLTFSPTVSQSTATRIDISTTTPIIIIVPGGATPTPTLIPFPTLAFNPSELEASGQLLVIQYEPNTLATIKNGANFPWRELLQLWPIGVLAGIWIILGVWFLISQKTTD